MARCCNRLLIGKTYWKGIALSKILFSSEVLDYTVDELNKLQRIENSVYRTILQLPTYTANSATIRGDIGASSCYARDMKTKILFAKHLLKENRNELTRSIFLKEIENSNNKWIKTVKTYMKKIDINTAQTNNLSTHDIIQKVKKWDTTNWKQETLTKSTLYIYNTYKTEIKEESWIDNTLGSKLIVRGRTNSLNLNWRNRFQNKSEQCPCCDCETETLEHFILDCKEYSDIRQNHSTLTHNTENQDRNNIIANILVFEKDLMTEEIENRKEYMIKIWKRRQSKIEEEEAR